MGSGVLFSNSTFDYSISYVWIKSFYGGFGGYSEGLNGTPPGSSNKYLSVNSITISGENFSQVSCGEPQFYPTFTVGATSRSCQVESPIMPGEPYNYSIALSNGMIFQNGEVADCLPRDCTISVTSAELNASTSTLTLTLSNPWPFAYCMNCFYSAGGTFLSGQGLQYHWCTPNQGMFIEPTTNTTLSCTLPNSDGQVQSGYSYNYTLEISNQQSLEGSALAQS